ncbi:MAG: DUF3078 domain-containing protein [Bacteroidales bacterium]|nr:DUF3078 domain-containing protein [Bacteroidales bacterium]
MRLLVFILLITIGFASQDTAFGQPETETVIVIPDTVKVDTINVQVLAVDEQRTDTVPSEKPIELVDTSAVGGKPHKVLTATQSLESITPVIPDSIPTKPITLSPSMASEYISGLISSSDLWRSADDNLKLSLLRLLNQYNEPYDSIRNRLLNFKWDSVKLKQVDVVEKDTLPLRWFDKSFFIVDTILLEKNPLITKRTVLMKIIDPLALSMLDLKQDAKEQVELLFETKDTITENIIDKKYLESKKIQLYEITDKGINPSLKHHKGFKPYRFNSDSTELIMIRTRKAFTVINESPFHIVPNSRMTDSLKTAIETLTAFTSSRDSILINVNDRQGNKKHLWLTSGKEDLHRYWVKNSKNDSITIWIGNPSKHNIVLSLEEDVNIERLEKRMVDDIPFTTARPDRQLAKLKPLKEIPVYWSYGIVGAYSLNENFFSNYWAQGGESSLTSMLDINAQAEYSNKESKLNWATTGRLRYGTTWTEDKGFRTSTDIVEVNSQYNKVLREKIDLSSIFYFKSQVAEGKNYSNDPPTVVSKFLNPGAITIGVGLEFKPNKKTSINFSPLSYRNTFVLDTATINQTVHGIDKGKRTKQEMGGQLLAKNSLTLFKDMEIKNTVRLFSSYLNKPQNVDVDWEMSVEKQISVYFKIRLNLHLIYDDDILFPIVNSKDEPVMLPSGFQKKAPRAQFNQLLGLTLVLKI